MLDLIAGHPAAEEVLAQGARVVGSHPREWLTRHDELFENVVAQPLLCLTELATWAALRDRVGEPGAFAGYSVGELAAYACAGAMDASLLASLARTRARLMDDAADRPGGLARGAWIASRRGRGAVRRQRPMDRDRQRRGCVRDRRGDERVGRVRRRGRRARSADRLSPRRRRLAHAVARSCGGSVTSRVERVGVSGAGNPGRGRRRCVVGYGAGTRNRQAGRTDCCATSNGQLSRRVVRAWLPVVSGARPRRRTLEDGARTPGCGGRGPLGQRISVP